jgi:hypothetical protein
MNNEIPLPDIFGKTNFLVFYNDSIYELAESRQKDYVKIYGKTFGLKKVKWEKVMKQYYKTNREEFRKLEDEFISSELENIASENREFTIKRIIDKYSPKSKYENFLFVDSKIYDLLAMDDFVSKFKGHFDSKFYAELEEKIQYMAPRELSQYLAENDEKYCKEDLKKICGKIWTNDKTIQLFIEDKYLVHLFKDEAAGFIENYKKWIEMEMKVKAAKKVKRGGRK